jgi:hypothetical protein
MVRNHESNKFIFIKYILGPYLLKTNPDPHLLNVDLKSWIVLILVNVYNSNPFMTN